MVVALQLCALGACEMQHNKVNRCEVAPVPIDYATKSKCAAGIRFAPAYLARSIPRGFSLIERRSLTGCVKFSRLYGSCRHYCNFDDPVEPIQIFD